MTKLGLALFLALGLAPAQAQTTFTMPPPAGVTLGGVQVVTSCGGATLSNGNLAFLAMDTTGKLCTNATGGGGGGGAVTAVAGAFVDGAIATIGTMADAACATDNGTCTVVALQKRTNQNIAAAVPAGPNRIGSVDLASNVTLTDCSATVVTGNTAVNAFTAQTTLHGFIIANTDTSEVMWISFTTTAAASTAASYPLSPATATTFAGLSSFSAPPGMGTNHALSVVAATNGHKFSCTWW